MKRKVIYIWNDKLIFECDRLPAVAGRASMVHELIASYSELIKQLTVVKSCLATSDVLREFHSDLYLKHLEKIKEIDADYMSSEQDEKYGIGYDCPPVSNIYNLVAEIAGGSRTAAKSLAMGFADVAINWCGGWHHAQRSGADGFCYVNDIVLAIEKLKEKFPKVLYIDLDVHHGNGVETAYNVNKSVFTLSFHKHEAGFYPGSGAIDEIGILDGKGYACNFPLHESYSDGTLKYAFGKVFNLVYDMFRPDAIVIQCGADALAGDPHGRANVTTDGYGTCVQWVLDKRKPTLLLGGGGYNHANTARLWCYLTALAVDVDIESDIPEHEYWSHYGPCFTLQIEPTLARDANKRSYLDECVTTIEENLKKYLPNAGEILQSNIANIKLSHNNTNMEGHRSRLLFRYKDDTRGTHDSTKENVYEFSDE